MHSKYYYKATIQYDGTNYCGFQWQKDIPTVQKEFNQSLKQLINGNISTVGASRTDTGVHAVEQIVKITTDQKLEVSIFLSELNKKLPSQVRCLSISPCAGLYKPASDHVSKEYRYLFTNILRSNGNDPKFVSNHPYVLNLDMMKKCALEIVGKHDFQNFCSAGSNVKTTIREILSCEISLVDPHTILQPANLFLLSANLKECYQLKIEGRGFLKQMVRHLMSALWLVGSCKISPIEFSLLLDGPKRTKRLWKVAPPHGLYLYRIKS